MTASTQGDFAELSGHYFSGLAEGAEADVFSEAGRRLAAFPLDGARRALEELVRCWSRIEPADPVATATAGRRDAAL